MYGIMTAHTPRWVEDHLHIRMFDIIFASTPEGDSSIIPIRICTYNIERRDSSACIEYTKIYPWTPCTVVRSIRYYGIGCQLKKKLFNTNIDKKKLSHDNIDA